jgi:hypothetical protein
MGREPSRRVGLFLLEGPGSGILFERDEAADGRTPVRIAGSGSAARGWAEDNYDDLLWEGPDRASALLSSGRSTSPAEPSRDTGAADLGPITYEADDFRTHLPEMVTGDHGRAIVQTWEEYTPESDRWEPFSTTLWDEGW